jgi:hypothetical protein
MAEELSVGTSAALNLAGVDWIVFRNAVGKKRLTAVAASTPAGNRREWTERPFAVLLFFQRLLQTSASSTYAGALADQFAKGMHNSPDAVKLGVYTVRRPNRKVEFLICEHPPEGGELAFEVPAAEYRSRAQELLMKYSTVCT